MTLLASGAVVPAAAQDDGPVVLVQARQEGPAVSPLLTGVNNDQWFDHSHGLWDGDGPDPEVVAKTERAGINIVRYPGGTPASLFDWKQAIGPVDQRGCQTDGRPGNGEPRDSIYGPDEHLEFVEAAGAQASIQTPFVRQTAQDAADWVEYMNAPVGTNPNGGVAWADVRAANGHPDPYGVGYWEVGNEHDRTAQRYWMSDDTVVAMRQYAFGGTQPQHGQLVGKGCDFSRDVASDGSASQVFTVAYPPLVPDSQTVYVDGQPWTEVDDLSSAAPADHVYTIDDATGDITFGNGTNGAVPPPGAQVTADYVSGPHDGFVDFYAAMKSVDPSIDVCATWAPITEDTGLGGQTLPDLLAAEGHGTDYDCLVVHPYTNFRRTFGSTIEYPKQMHDWHMLGEAAATRTLQHYADAVRAHRGDDAYVTTSELGALFFGGHNAAEYRSWNTAMSHATYFASQWTRLANLGVPWAEGNTLVSEAPTGLRAVLGGEPEFVETSEAVVRRALRPLVEGGGHVVRNRVQENPLQQAEATELGSSYEALATTATVAADGTLTILVVNRDPDDDVTAKVVPAGLPHAGTAEVSRVIGTNDDPNRESFESHNAISHPDEVRLTTSQVDVGQDDFAFTFPKHSVTLIYLAPLS
jgi:alpha-N-arabinofuranosidase